MKTHALAALAVAGLWLPDALMIAGAGSVSYGAWQVFAPAGYVCAGVFSIVAGLLVARGAK